MKFTLAEIKLMSSSLSKLVHLDLPIRISYRLSKLLNFFDKEIMTVENARRGLVKKYASDNKDEEGMRVAKEHEEEFRVEFEKLLTEEVEFAFEPISIDELGNIKMSPMDLVRINKIIKENQGN